MLGNFVRRSLIFVIFTLLFISLGLSLFSQTFLPWSYILFSFFVSITLIVIVFYFNVKSPLIYVCIIISAILLRNLFNIATNFTIIPLYDSYQDLAAMKIFEETGRNFIIEPFAAFLGEGISDTSYYPLPLVFVNMLSTVTGINLIQICLLVPTVYSLLWLLFIALFVKDITIRLGLDNKVLPLSLLIFAFSPDAIYNGMLFRIRFHAFVFFYMALYLLFRNIYFAKAGKKDLRKVALLMISCIAMVLSHSLTPFIFALFLLCMYVSIPLGKKLLSGFKNSSVGSQSFSITLFAFVSFFSWQLYYAIGTVRLYKGFTGFFANFLGTRLGAVGYLTRPYYISESLMPEPAMFVLYLRDIAIYVPAIIGFIMFTSWFLKKRVGHGSQFLLSSLFSLTVIFIIMNVTNLVPLTMKDYAIPFITLFAALLYARTLSRKISLFKLISGLMMMLVVFTAFLSPWSHTHFPLYVYDPSIKSGDVGVHNPLCLGLEPFINDYASRDKLFLSDDPHLLYAMLQPKDYGLIGSLDDEKYQLFAKPGTYIIELLHLNPHGHYLLDFEGLEEIKSRMPIEYNRVLDAQHYRIYVRE